MPHGCGRAESAARIPSRGLYPEFLERAFTQYAAVGDAVQGNAPGQAQIFFACFRMQRFGKAQHHFFGNHLYRTRNIHFTLADF